MDLRAALLCVGKQRLQAVVVPVVDDGAVVVAGWPVGIKAFNRRVIERHEACQIVLMNQQVIGRDTGLARV